ncbi:MAG: hypothetical protein M1813_006189 [Trichoglossum hirsutum]|nr:MAG: hypothetical protein M1813_006189 [Trichoglossum hirsutum]
MAIPTQFAYRTLKGIGVVNADPVYEALPGFERPEGNLRCCTYSPCGRYFAWASPEQVIVVDASVGHTITTLPAQNVFELGFSPRGSFIITWERVSKDEDGNATKNLKVWRTVEDTDASGVPVENAERSVVGKFVQKSQTGWNLQYTSDERYCARVVTNEVHFYESGDLGTVWNKLRVEGVVDFALSPGKNHSIAVFIPERKGQPAAIKLFNVPHFSSAVSQKTFYKGDKVQLKWNDLGTSLIVLAQTEVDKTGKSYYGETNLYILSANGGFDSRIQLDKEGPIHDVTWSPSSKEFGVVYGYMPAKTTIFNARAVSTHSFPLAPRNTIMFSPHGRFVLVAGFGNLTGQMDVFDLEKDYEKVATIEASNASVCEWSPDGRFILTATTSPRLRVDNGVRIWHAGGGLMYKEELNELYNVIPFQVCWRPESVENHPLGNPLHPVPTPHASALAYLGTVKTPSKPAGAYRPPGARGQVTPLHFKREDEGGAAHVNNGSSSSSIINGFGKSRRREVPGAEPASEKLPPGAAPGGGVSLTTSGDGDEGLSKAALKNKKKREAKKAKEAAEKAAAAAGGSSAGDVFGGDSSRDIRRAKSPDRRDRTSGRDRSRSNLRSRNSSQRRDNSGRDASRHRRNQSSQSWNIGSSNSNSSTAPTMNNLTILSPPPNAQITVTSVPSSAAVEISITSPGGGSPHDKKLRGLLKKVRAIEDLKMRLAGGEKLEDTQMKKIATEDGVRRELEALGWSG